MPNAANHRRKPKKLYCYKEENDCLMRLADAVAGFVRAATGNSKFGRLLASAVTAKIIKEV